MKQLLQNNSKFFQNLRSNQGFSLIEILIALVLVVIAMGALVGGQFSNEDLRKETDGLERAVRFMSDESTLRNAVVRLHIMLGKAPQEYAVEYGPTSNFVLPPESDNEGRVLSKEDEEKEKSKEKQFNLQFNKVQEFQESNTEISDNVKIIGIGSSTAKKLKTTGDVSIYAYPSGEKDDALIILADDHEVMSLAISAFTNKIERKSEPVTSEGTNRDINVIQEEKAKEMFEAWLKNQK